MLLRSRVRAYLFVSLALLVSLLQACAGGGPHAPAPPEIPLAPPFVDTKLLDGPALDGVMAEGRAGDWLLQNERLEIVVRGPRNDEIFPDQVGQVVDAAPAGGVDLLRDVSLLVGGDGGAPVRFESVGRAEAPDSEGVALLLEGGAPGVPGLRVETRITLRKSDSAVNLLTRLVNRGADPIQGLPVVERIRWGRAEPLLPGADSSATTVAGLRFVVGTGSGTSYAWIRSEGGGAATRGSKETRIELGTADLAPGEEITYRRRFLVLPGSGAGALAAAWQALGTATGTLEVRVLSSRHKDPVDGARIDLIDDEGVRWGTGATDASGAVRLVAPPGTYRIHVRHPGRGGATSELVQLEAGSGEQVEVRLPDPAHVRLQLLAEGGSPASARWTFHGVEGTPDPDFGPPDRGPAARNVFFGRGSGDEIDVPPGSYRLVAARGGSFEIWESRIQLQEGKDASVEASLPSLGVPPGWRSADLQVRTFRSPGCTVSLADRKAALRSDGIDAFVLADLGWRTDPGAETVDLLAIPGEGIETEGGGTVGIFPVEADPGRPGRGALDPDAIDRIAALDSLLESSPSARIQLLRPPLPDSLQVSMMELLTSEVDFGSRWEAWIDLLRRGHRVLATGGGPHDSLLDDGGNRAFTWILVDSTTARPGAADLLSAIRSGALVASRGPFVHFTLEGREVGSVQSRSIGLLHGHVEVLAPPGIEVSRVSVYVNGVEDSVYRIEGADRPLRFDEDIEIDLKGAAFVVVTVEGRQESSPGIPSVGENGWTRPIDPLAVTSPIWVEISRASR